MRSFEWGEGSLLFPFRHLGLFPRNILSMCEGQQFGSPMLVALADLDHYYEKIFDKETFRRRIAKGSSDVLLMCQYTASLVSMDQIRRDIDYRGVSVPGYRASYMQLTGAVYPTRGIYSDEVQGLGVIGTSLREVRSILGQDI